LIAYLFHKFHFYSLAVEIAVEIEQVRLEQRLFAVDRRPDAQARDGGPHSVADATHAHGKNAAERRRAPPEMQARGRKAAAAADMLTARDVSAHRKRMPEQMFAGGDVAGAEYRADARTRDAVAVEHVRRDDVGAHPVVGADPLQQRQIAGAVVSEAETLA